MTIAPPASVSAACSRTAAAAASDCAICDAMEGTVGDYVAHVLSEPRHLQLSVETTVDSIGFCARHGVRIAKLQGGSIAIRAFLERAVSGILALLDGCPGGEDRLRDLLFAASGACPACSFEGRRLTPLLARHARLARSSGGRLAPALCLRHFHALVSQSGLDELPRWAAMEAECLSAAAAALEHGMPDTLTATARLIAGPCAASSQMPTSEVCSVCDAMTAARNRWLILLRDSLRTDAAPEMLLPLCGEHIWLCHSIGQTQLSERATRYALEIAVRRLRQAAAKLEEEERRLEREKTSVWYRARSPAYLLGQRRRIVTDMPRCPACERIAIARDRAVFNMLEELPARRGRDTEQVRGLCMKHFAYSRVVAPAGGVRHSLTQAQVEALRTLEKDLETSGPELNERALLFLSGTAS